MTAQWENESISLSVLSMARVMIAQCENECISLSVLPVARAMIAQWENECISLSVLSMARVQFPWWSISRDFCLADHPLPARPEPAWQRMTQSFLNGTTQPVDIEEEGRSPTTDRRWLKQNDSKPEV